MAQFIVLVIVAFFSLMFLEVKMSRQAFHFLVQKVVVTAFKSKNKNGLKINKIINRKQVIILKMKSFF